MRTCYKCNKQFSATHGRQTYCHSPCMPMSKKDRNVINNRKYFKKNVENLLDYYGGVLKCEICGYISEHGREFYEWHHKDPSSKDKTIGSLLHGNSWDKVRKELDKCLCLCPNCHTSIHINTWGSKTGVPWRKSNGK